MFTFPIGQLSSRSRSFLSSDIPGVDVEDSYIPGSGDTIFSNQTFAININTALATGSNFTLPLRTGFNYDFLIKWGDGDENTITTYNDANLTHTYASEGIYTIEITGVCESIYFNASTSVFKITAISISDLGFTDCENMFFGAINMEDITVIDGAAFKNVSNFKQAFAFCRKITTFPALDLSSGTNFESAWEDCELMTTFESSNLSAGTNFASAWRDCAALTTFLVLNLSSGTNFSYAWETNTSLTTFPAIDLSSGTNFTSAWDACFGLTTFPAIDLSSGTNFDSAWNDCFGLTTFPPLNVSSGTNFNAAFAGLTGLTTFPQLNWGQPEILSNTWSSSVNITSITGIGSINITNITTAASMLAGITLNTSNYDSLLIGWESQAEPASITLSGGNSKYSAGAATTARAALELNSWTITDGGQE